MKFRKRLFGVAMAAVTAVSMICMGLTLPQTSVTVHAAGEKWIMMDASVLGTGVNTGDAAKVYYGATNVGGNTSQEWRVIGYNGDSNGVIKEAGVVTLLSSGTIGNNTQFNPDSSAANANAYNGSSLQSAVNNLYSGGISGTGIFVTAAEKGVIVKRTLQGGQDIYAGADTDKIEGDSVDAYLWPLSAKEANDTDSGIRDISSDWWLRSPGNDALDAAFV